jgi:hypothetical protein
LLTAGVVEHAGHAGAVWRAATVRARHPVAAPGAPPGPAAAALPADALILQRRVHAGSAAPGEDDERRDQQRANEDDDSL